MTIATRPRLPAHVVPLAAADVATGRVDAGACEAGTEAIEVAALRDVVREAVCVGDAVCVTEVALEASNVRGEGEAGSMAAEAAARRTATFAITYAPASSSAVVRMAAIVAASIPRGD